MKARIMMKIIIDIDEENYKSCQTSEYVRKIIYCDLVYAIRKGTILPKGHGRLIDADKLIKQLEMIANDEWNKQVGSSKGLEDAIDIVDDTPIIIEADNVESEE